MVVSHLDLGGCRLHRGLPDGMLFVLKQYFAPTLTSLNLGGTDLPIAETLSVLQSLEKLQSLHLGANGLGNDGVMALVPWLATASHLTIVDLRYNDIGPVGCESLCKGLRQQKEFLKLQQESTSNTTTTTTTARTSNRGVAKLYLEGNNVQDAGAIALATHYPLAEADSPLKELFLGANHIGPDGAASLAKCLITNKTLSKLYLEGNHIRVEGADAFTKVLTTECGGNTGLKHLFCDNNDIGKEGSKRLAAALNSGTAIGDTF